MKTSTHNYIRALLLAFSLLFSQASAASELPDLVFKDFPIAEESDPEVHDLVKTAAMSYHPEPEQAREKIVEALSLVDKGASISDYDYLWTQYGLLKSSFYTNTSEFGPGTKNDYIRVATNVLDYLDRTTSTGIWYYTDEGQFQMEVYREAGNGLAWHLFSDNDDEKSLAAALSAVEKGVDNIRDSQDYYIYDTKVRILLKMGKREAAYQIVQSVLSEEPEFSDFQDIKQDDGYIAWQKQ